ncbi:MAG TPA: hypothetical protein VFC07_10245 [Verrucomicrobiae bacterium]|nr:hypothetical protein [Verrucomicrobiae bacterium]
MKPSDKSAFLVIPASILIPVGVFARPLGLSGMEGFVIFLAALVLLLLGYRRMIKAGGISGKTGEASNSMQPTTSQRQILHNRVLQPQVAGGGEGGGTSAEQARIGA